MAGERYWILYNISINENKTPYYIWVYSDKWSLKYNNKWNVKKLDAMAKNEKPYLSSLWIFEEAKKLAYIPFEESKLDNQELSIRKDDNLRPFLSILNVYNCDGAFFALGMDFIYNKDILPDSMESWTPFFPIANAIKLDLKSSNYNELEKYLEETIEGFDNSNFEPEFVSSTNADQYNIVSVIENRLKPYFQKSYLVYGLKFHDLQTPYKVVVTVDSTDKLEYCYNFSAKDLNSFMENEFIKNTSIPETEIQRAIEICNSTAKETFTTNRYFTTNGEYELISQEIIKGLDEELRFYVDVKMIYKNKKYLNDSKLGVFSRYYISL